MPLNETTPDQAYADTIGKRKQSAAFQRILDEMGTQSATATMAPDATGEGAAASTGGQSAPDNAAPAASGDQPGILSKIGTAAKNTAYGTLFEVVPQLIAGRIDGLRHAASSINDFDSWLRTSAPWLYGGEGPGGGGAEGVASKDALLAQNDALRHQAGGGDFNAKDMFGIGGTPETGIGGFARKVSELTTFYNPAMKALQAGNVTGFMAAPLAGAFSQFMSQDPKDAGVANLLTQFPMLQPFAEKLATDPNDSDTVNRLRHAVEGLGLGVATEGIVRGVKAFGAWLHAKPAATEVAQGMSAAEKDANALVGAVDRDVLQVGTPEKPFEIVKTPAQDALTKLRNVEADVGPSVPGQVTAKAIKEAAPLDDVAVNVNWNNINNGNLKGVIGDIASELKGRIDTARRGTITLDAQRQMADQLGMTVEDLLARPIGKTYSAEELIAGGKLLESSQRELYRLAHIAEMPMSSEADAIRVNQQLITHMAVLENFLGASGEAGRALGAMRAVHASGAVARAQMMKQFLDSTGGVEGARNLSGMLVDLEKAGVPPGGVNAALQRGWGQWTWDAFKEAFSLGFLWSPKTHARNVVGNMANVIQQSVDRSMAEKFSVMMGTPLEDAVVPGEAAAYTRGAMGSLREAFRQAGKSFATGQRWNESLPNAATDAMGSSIARPPALSAQGIAIERGLSAAQADAFAETGFGKAIDFIGNTVRLPGRFLSSADDFFKIIGYQGQREALAYRQAMQEGLTGDALTNRVADLITNSKDISVQAVDHALYATFNDALGTWGQWMMKGHNVAPVYVVMPYVRTPSNLFKTAVEHSYLSPFLAQTREAVAAGGAQRDLALAKMATGAATLALLVDWAHNGHITGAGPTDPAVRQAMEGAGWRPTSIHVKGVNVGISGLGQLSPAIAFAGALSDMFKKKDLHPEAYDTVDEWAASAASILAQSTVNQSYMTGLAKFMSGLEEGARGEEGAMGSYFRDLAGSMSNLVPGVPLARTVGAGIDPQQRQIGDVWDALIFKNMPGLSDKLIPARDVFGHEIQNQPAGVGGQIYNFLSPFRLSWDNDHPAFNELVRLNSGLSRIPWKSTFMGVKVNFRDYPEVLDYYRRLAGNELKYNPRTGEKQGMEDFMNAVVSGKDPLYGAVYKYYTDGPDGTKAAFLKETAAAYRKAAQEQIMSEAKERFPKFYDEIVKGQMHNQQQKLPTYMQGSEFPLPMTLQKQEPLPDRLGRPSTEAAGFKAQ